jgi:RNA polymerase sigma factor (sigma-70 family)
VSRFEGYARGKAYGLLKDWQLAEDAVQEAFLEASLKLHQLETPEAFPGWFGRIIFKRCDRFTRGKHLATAALDQAVNTPVDTAAADVEAGEAERHALLREAVSLLPEHERGLVTAFYLEGRSQKELVAESGLPLTTVKKRLHTARQRLRHVLDAWEPSAAAGDEAPGFTPREQLFMAAWNGFAGKSAALLRTHPELAHAVNDDGMGILLFAAHAQHHTGRGAVVEVLLQHGARLDAHSAAALGRNAHECRVSPGGPAAPVWGRTPLHWAACGGHAALALDLLAAGADVNAPDHWGCTPLHLAADFGHEVLVDALIAHRAQVGAAMKNGKLPIHLAASHRKRGLLRALVGAGARVDLFCAAAMGDLRLGERLLDRDQSALHAELTLGATPLHLAAESGQRDMVRFLAARGAPLDLLSAAHLGRMEDVDRLLVEAPETINARAGSFGFTALHYASIRGWRGLARILLARGADAALTDRMYLKTPLDEALYFGREDLAQLLRHHTR